MGAAADFEISDCFRHRRLDGGVVVHSEIVAMRLDFHLETSRRAGCMVRAVGILRVYMAADLVALVWV